MTGKNQNEEALWNKLYQEAGMTPEEGKNFSKKLNRKHDSLTIGGRVKRCIMGEGLEISLGPAPPENIAKFLRLLANNIDDQGR